MCGIVAYVGDKPCRQHIFDGLLRLEYRGYDSAGFVCVDNKSKRFCCHKEAGMVDIVKKMSETVTCDGSIGMGHTRWATHGIVNQVNAHPHFNCSRTIAVVHNGIIEGFEKIRASLIKEGHEFCSSTDSEVAAHLFSTLLEKNKSISSAVIALTQKLDGAYALIYMLESHPDKLIVIRRKSPMVIGVGNNEMFVASDFLAFSDKTNQIIFVPDDSFAIVTKDNVAIYDFQGNLLNVKIDTINATYATVDKQNFEHFMIKEIYEQKHAIMRTINFFNTIGSMVSTDNLNESNKKNPLITHAENNLSLWRQLGVTADQISTLKTINLVAAGTSWHAARIAQFFFEMIAKIPTHVYLASEFRYMPLFVNKDSLFIMLSQSGETADTLEALRLVNSLDMQTIAITNVPSSSIVREASGFLPMQAGPEISVAATKTFTSQVASLYWLANRMAYERGMINLDQLKIAQDDLFIAAEILETTLETNKLRITQELAPYYAKFDKFIFLSRHINYPFALEAALKLKEVSYIFAQCYPAGELKHGPIALVDEHTPVVIFSVLDELIYNKLVSNAHEVKTRRGHVIAFAFEGQTELIDAADVAFIIPRVNPLLAPIAMSGIMQFFVYQMARELDRPPDKPRNLAKSVTVE
ncbi:MAG: Isomerizing Glutamine-fructose-6-phosphate aminotransferase [candidate division TM6 bacterium GW2011_GWF2_38_10]|nr:MAG: Isomerizing Glutamine-fructose-6-phosphate aminotransferase [candidate division TM6 bacterium GW2011_GWF2_38_10]